MLSFLSWNDKKRARAVAVVAPAAAVVIGLTLSLHLPGMSPFGVTWS